MLEVSGASINDMYVGQSEKNVRALFSLAKKLSPLVIFIDEADALFAARGQSRSRPSHRETINQFLREWDGMSDTKAFIMVATNRPFDLDDAVLRRLPRKILVDLPLQEDRESILRILLKGEQLDASVSIEDIARRTVLYSGSDLKNLTVAAAMAAVQEELEQAALHTGSEPYVYPERRTLLKRHFDKASGEIAASIKLPVRGPFIPSLLDPPYHAAATDNAPDPNDNFLSGNTANYIDEMYMQWKEDPKSVHVSWQVYFRNMESGDMPISQAFTPPPSLVPGATGGVPRLAAGSAEGTEVANHLKVQLLVRAYQARGHNKANIDPLGIRNEQKGFGNIKPKELTLEHYQFTEKDLDTEYSLGPGILPRFKREGREKMTLREIIDACERIYCGSYGIEFIHIPDREKCDWLRERLEVPQPFKYSIDEKRRILDRLIWSSSFESFLSTKYPNDKRFGLEGCETLVPGMKALIDRSVDYGVKDIVIGMPHRGRLNVLSNVVRKPNESIFSEFAGTAGAEDEGSGDVKYHLGMNFERPTPSGKRVQLSLVAN
ncbi:hypothetical protein BN1708_016861, partial [Verticillium longisporum]